MIQNLNKIKLFQQFPSVKSTNFYFFDFFWIFLSLFKFSNCIHMKERHKSMNLSSLWLCDWWQWSDDRIKKWMTKIQQKGWQLLLSSNPKNILKIFPWEYSSQFFANFAVFSVKTKKYANKTPAKPNRKPNQKM